MVVLVWLKMVLKVVVMPQNARKRSVTLFFGLPLAVAFRCLTAVGGAGDGECKFQPTLTGSRSPYQARIPVRLRNTRRTERAGTGHRVKFWYCSRKIR